MPYSSPHFRPVGVSLARGCYVAALAAFSPFLISSVACAQNAPKMAPVNGSRPAAKPIDRAPFTAFSDWVARYQSAPKGDARTALETEGALLTTRRVAALREAVETDAATAIALSLTPEAKAALPVAVADLVEAPFAGVGNLDVLIADFINPKTGEMTHGEIMRRLTLNGKTYPVVAYGHRARLTTKQNLPVSGFIIGGVAVLRGDAVRALPAGTGVPAGARVGNPDKICPISKTDASNGVIGEMGGTYYYFATGADLREFAKRQEARESVVGPDTGSVEAE